MLRKKAFVRLILMVFVILVLIVFVVQNPALSKDVGKGVAKATAWIVKGGVKIYNDVNISEVNLSKTSERLRNKDK
jgi:hypothetical protein